jgi:hypothetical protein
MNSEVVFVGDAVRLTGKTRHGKNRVRENGKFWEVITVDGEILPRKICVRPVVEGCEDNWRWVDFPEDEHMEVEINA